MKALLTKKNAIIAALVAILFTAGGSLYLSNKGLKNNLKSERLKSENLLAQKLHLDKSLEQSKKDVAELQGKANTMERKLSEINQQIDQKNSEINRLRAQNGSIKDLRNKISELENLKAQRDEELNNLNKTLALAQAENASLSEKLASAVKAKSTLMDDNHILKALVSDNYRTEAFRGKNEKLTVNARKTKKLMVSFDLPSDIPAKEVYFKVFTPEGLEYSSAKDLAATISFIDNDDHLIASSDQAAFGPSGSRRIEMAFNPKKKLTQGVYRFNLYNGERFLGSTQLRLR